MGKYGFLESTIIVSSVFLILGWLVCFMRAWVKLVIIKKVTLDDYLMLAGIVFYTAYAACSIYGPTHSAIHPQTLAEALAAATVGLRTWWLCEMLYAPLSLCVRTSVAVFLRQIAVDPVHRRVIVATMAVFWVATVPLFFVIVFQCRPVAFFWKQPDPSVPRGRCLDSHVLYYVSIVHSVIGACCDLVLGTLPIVMLWKVRLNKRTKVSLSLLLGMGIFAGIALIVRITYVRPLDLNESFIHRSVNLANWSILEPSLCIIAGCLATLRPLFSCCFGRNSSTAPRAGLTDSPTQYDGDNTHDNTHDCANKSRTIKSSFRGGVGFIFKPAYLYPRNTDTSHRSTGLLRYVRAADESSATAATAATATNNTNTTAFELTSHTEKAVGGGITSSFAETTLTSSAPATRLLASRGSDKSVQLVVGEER